MLLIFLVVGVDELNLLLIMSYGHNPGYMQPPYGTQQAGPSAMGGMSGMNPGMGGMHGMMHTGMQSGMGMPGMGGMQSGMGGMQPGMGGMQPGMGGMSGMPGMQSGMGGMSGMGMTGMGGMPGMQPGMGGMSGMPGMQPGMGGPQSGMQRFGGPQPGYGGYSDQRAEEDTMPAKPKRLVVKLTNQERGYYANLLAQADPESKGRIEGPQAVAFFKKSNLPVEQLREIWNIATMTGESYLDRDRFFIAMRLISCAQQGKPVSADSISSNVAVDLPNFELEQRREDPWELNEEDKSKYVAMFNQLCQGKGFLAGTECIAIFRRSELTMEDLAKIWTLSDPQDSGQLNSSQFTVAMHMIMTLKRRSMNVPDTLPLSLKAVMNAPPSSGDSFGMGMGPMSSPSMPSPGPQMMGMGQMGMQSGGMPQSTPPKKQDAFDFGDVKAIASQIQPKQVEFAQAQPQHDFMIGDVSPKVPAQPPKHPDYQDQSMHSTRYIEPSVSQSLPQEYSIRSQPAFEENHDNDPMKPMLVQQYKAVLLNIRKIQGALELADNFDDHKPVLQDVSAKLSELLGKLERPSSHISPAVEKREAPKSILKPQRQDDLMGSMDASAAKKPQTVNIQPQVKASLPSIDEDPFAFPPSSSSGSFPSVSSSGFPPSSSGSFPQSSGFPPSTSSGGFPQSSPGGFPQSSPGGFPQSSSGSFQTSSMAYPSLDAGRAPSQFSTGPGQFSFNMSASTQQKPFQADFDF